MLEHCQNEKDVENTYRNGFLRFLSEATITSPHRTDGVLRTDTLFVLLEFKHDYDFGRRGERCEVLMQCVVYLRRFYEQGDQIPTSIFVGDINECFAMPSEQLLPYRAG